MSMSPNMQSTCLTTITCLCGLYCPRERDILQLDKSSKALLQQGKLRLDAFLTAQVPETSRGKLQAAIKAGNVTVNGKQQVKTSLVVRPGDDVQCILLDPPLMEAAPEVTATQPNHALIAQLQLTDSISSASSAQRSAAATACLVSLLTLLHFCRGLTAY